MSHGSHAGRIQGPLAAALAAVCLWGADAAAQHEPGTIPAITRDHAARLDTAFADLLAEHGVVTAGMGLIRGGKLVWTAYYGEQSPGVPASRSTLFNVASITKTVTAETILRLVSDGRLSLDESMSGHWTDPDLAADPRHRSLTPRMALTHSTGFANWRGRSPLAMSTAPGTAETYSGEGTNYVARFAEEKLGRPFHTIVREYVSDPIGIPGMSISTPNGWVTPYLALPTDESRPEQRLLPGCTTTGQFCLCRSDPRPLCRRWTAADDMLVTVEDYAAFLISVISGEGLSAELRAERFRPVQHPRGDWQITGCGEAAGCPAEGWGLGWEVVDYGDRALVTHGGADWGEAALAYFYTGSGDGLIVFLNGRRPGAFRAMAQAVRLIDAASPLPARYERWVAP